MSSLFSSPSKQAQSVANAEQGINQQDISQIENYVADQQKQLRAGIAGLGANPYLAAAPSGPARQVNPDYTATFSGGTPAVTSGMPPASTNPFGPPQKKAT